MANLDGQPSVVVGDRAGYVYAYHLAGGTGVAGWPYNAGAPDRLLALGGPHLRPTGSDSVFVGSGNVGRPHGGRVPGHRAPTGATSGSSAETNPGTDPTPHSGVAASLTVGSYAGGYGVEAGSLGQNTYALRRRQRGDAGRLPVVLGGLGVLDGCGGRPLRRRQQRDHQRRRLERGRRPTGRPTATAGHIRILSSAGNAGTGNPAGGLICQYNTTQNIDRSSPAVGQFLAGGGVGIAVGDGSYYPGASDSNKVFALNTSCGLAWSDTLDGVTADSPALADVEGNGQLDVVEGTAAGTIYALNGTNGAAVWSAATTGQVIGSPVTADLTGGGYQDVIVPTTDGHRHLRRALGRRGGHPRQPATASRARRW